MAHRGKIFKSVTRVVQRTSLIPSSNILIKGNYNRVLQTLSASTEIGTENGKPIKFSDSQAGKWKARYTYYGENVDKVPGAQQYAVVFSLSAFLIYFCILREENDLDDFLRTAETKVPDQLKKAVENATSNSKTQNYPEKYVHQRILHDMMEKEKKASSARTL